jgi:hypothetical protein
MSVSYACGLHPWGTIQADYMGKFNSLSLLDRFAVVCGMHHNQENGHGAS